MKNSKRHVEIYSLTVSPYGPGFPGLVHPGFTHFATYKYFAQECGRWVFGGMSQFCFRYDGDDAAGYAMSEIRRDLNGREVLVGREAA